MLPKRIKFYLLLFLLLPTTIAEATQSGPPGRSPTGAASFPGTMPQPTSPTGSGATTIPVIKPKPTVVTTVTPVGAIVPKCPNTFTYYPTSGTGGLQQNVTDRTLRPIGLPNFEMDVSGANVFRDSNKIPDSSLLSTGWAPDPVHTISVTSQAPPAQNQANTFQCDFDDDACGFSGSPSHFYYSTCETTACRANGESAFSDACGDWGCLSHDGGWSVPIHGTHSAMLSLGEFAREAWIEKEVPQGISNISFDHAHTWGMANCPSDYCSNFYATLQVLLDGQEVANYIPEYQRDTSVSSSSYVMHYVAPWKHESISIDPSRPHNLKFKIAVYDIGNPRDDQAFIDDIVFSGTPPPSSTTRYYSLHIDQLNGGGGYAPIENFQRINSGARHYLVVPMTAAPRLIGIKGIIGPEGPPVTEMWTAIQNVTGHMATHPGPFAAGVSLNSGALPAFTVEAGEAFNGGGPGLFNFYPLNILADASAPVDLLFHPSIPTYANLATLGSKLVLPWYGAVIPFSYQDDTSMKGMKVVSGSTEIFNTNFATDIYTQYPRFPSIAGKIVLSETQIGRIPVTMRRFGSFGGSCIDRLPEATIGEQGTDIAGRTVAHNMGSAVVFNVPPTADIVSSRYDLTAGQSATVSWNGLPCLPPEIKVKFKVWTIPPDRSAPVNHDNWITEERGNSATFTPQSPGRHEVEALLVTADGRSYLKKATPNVAWFDVPSIPVRSPIAMGVGENKVLICPAELACGMDEKNVESYDILKRPNGSTASYGKVGTVTKEVFNRDCYADTGTTIPNTRYQQYVLQANFTGGGKSDKSPPDIAEVRSYPTEFWMDHVPMSTPMKFKVLVKNRNLTHSQNVPVRIFATGGERFGDYCFLLTEAAANTGTPCVVATQESLFDKGILLNTGSGDGAQAWLHFTDATDDLQGTSKNIQVMLGDMAKKWELLSVAQQDNTFSAMTVPLEEIPATQYLFHGDGLGFINDTKGQMYDVLVPVMPESFQTMIHNFYSGLLPSDEWRRWAGDHFEGMENLASLRLDDPLKTASYLNALVSRDLIALADYSQQPGNNLFEAGSSLPLDWYPAVDKTFFDPDIALFLQFTGRSSPSASIAAQAYIQLIQDAAKKYYLEFAAAPPSWADLSSLADSFSEKMEGFWGGFPAVMGCPLLEDSAVSEDWPQDRQPATTQAVYSAYLNDLEDHSHVGPESSWSPQFQREYLNTIEAIAPIIEAGRIGFKGYISEALIGIFVGGEYNFTLDAFWLNHIFQTRHYRDAYLTLLHEGVHARHRRDFEPQNNLATFDQLEEWAQMDETERLLYMNLGLIAYGQYTAFTESHAFLAERKFSGLECAGSTDREKETAAFKNDVMSNSSYISKLTFFGLCHSSTLPGGGFSPCGDERDLWYERNGQRIPWSPVGKTSPWED